MKVIKESHTDHLTPEVLAYVEGRFADREAFFIETIELPKEYEPMQLGIRGPSVGDPEVTEDEVKYKIRKGRKCASRIYTGDIPARMTRELTVVAGPNGDDPCVLYTAYPGPAAVREPGDSGIASWEELLASRVFWTMHALVETD